MCGSVDLSNTTPALPNPLRLEDIRKFCTLNAIHIYIYYIIIYKYRDRKSF